MKKTINTILVALFLVPAVVWAYEPAVASGVGVLTPAVQLDQAPKVTINRVQEEVMSKHKVAIQSIVTSNKYKSYGIKGAVAVVLAYLAYKSYQAWISPELPALDLDIARIPHSAEGFTQLKQVVMQNRDGAVASFGSWLWFKRNGALLRDHILSTLAATSIWATGEKYLQSVDHPDSIDWFTNTHTNFMPTIEELRQLGIVLDSPQYIEQGPAMHAKLIVMVCNSLIAQLEHILAYMEYRQEQFKGTAAHDVAELIRYTFNCTNEFAGRIEGVLNDTNPDGKMRRQGFENAVDGFKRELARTLMRYRHAEREQALQ